LVLQSLRHDVSMTPFQLRFVINCIHAAVLLALSALTLASDSGFTETAPTLSIIFITKRPGEPP
jgi:hypothetical protein